MSEAGVERDIYVSDAFTNILATLIASVESEENRIPHSLPTYLRMHLHLHLFFDFAQLRFWKSPDLQLK